MENNARYLRQMRYRIVEDIDVSQSDFQTMLDELTDAKNSLVQHNGYMPRQWVFDLIPREPGHLLKENSDLPNLYPEGRFRRIAEMRHKCRMAAIETEKNAKIAKKYCANNDVKSHSLKTILHILTIILARARARTLHSNREGHQYGRIAEHTQCTRTIVPTWRWQSGLLDESSCIGGKSTKAMMGINERKRSIKTEVVARVQKKEQTWSKSRQYRLSMRARHQQRGTSRSTGSACRTSSSIENPAAAV